MILHLSRIYVYLNIWLGHLSVLVLDAISNYLDLSPIKQLTIIFEHDLTSLTPHNFIMYTSTSKEYEEYAYIRILVYRMK